MANNDNYQPLSPIDQSSATPQFEPILSSFSRHLSRDKAPILLDGGLATHLESLGADISGSLWSAELLISNPNLIYRTHLDFFRAGANVAITASYQASIAGLKKHLHLGENAAAGVVKKSVYLALKARQDYLAELGEEERHEREGRLWIAGSVGPYGAFLADGSEYRGDYELSIAELKDFHRGRIAALVDAGVDVLAFETLPNFSEIQALAEVLKEFRGAKAWVSCTLRDGSKIADGTSLARVADLLNREPQVEAIGVNCAPEQIASEAIIRLSSLTKKPLVVYPNSGEEWDAGKRDWKGQKMDNSHLTEITRTWFQANARLVGGCCRTTPQDITIMKNALASK